MRRRARAAALGLALAVACRDGGGALTPPVPPPAVLSAAASPGPANVLSAEVTATLADADSARVRFGLAGQALDSATPARPAGPRTTLPVLGLRPDTGYQLVVVAYGHGDSALGDTLALTTGPLPGDLPSYAAAGAGPTPGYVALAAFPYGLVLDNTGRVVWYRRLEGAGTLNFQPQPGGLYATAPITTTGDSVPWILYDPLGREVRRLGCAGLTTRFHELLLGPDGGAWLLCDEVRTLDLSGLGGDAAAQVTASVIQHRAADGTLRFEWRAFDHVALTDLDPVLRSGPQVNFTHANALTFEGDGHLLVSFRSLNEIMAIDTATGAVAWRLGGRANQFSITGAVAPFAGQHGLRVTGPGQLQFLDNRGLGSASRVVRYVVDAAAQTAQEVASLQGVPTLGLLGGSTQALPGGHLLAAYGNGNRVEEYDGAGAVVWQVLGNPGYVFRATRIASLYDPRPLP